jgi:hypothetical protein
MSWETEDGRHEGSFAPVFADGVHGSGYTGAGVLIMKYDDQGTYTGVDETRPDDQVVGWRVLCNCVPASVSDPSTYSVRERERWEGPLWHRVFTQAEEDLSRHLVESEDALVSARCEQLMRKEWRRHVDPDQTSVRIREAADAAAVAARNLDDAVALAKLAGASWETVGRAARVTRQTAHERWRHVASYVAGEAVRWAQVDSMEQWINKAPDGPSPLRETISAYLEHTNPFPDGMEVEVLNSRGGSWQPGVIVERVGADEWTVEYGDGDQVWRDHQELRPVPVTTPRLVPASPPGGAQ